MLGYNSSFAKAVIGSTFGSVPSTFEMDDVSIIVLTILQSSTGTPSFPSIGAVHWDRRGARPVSTQ